MEEKVEWMDGVVVERGRSDLKLGRVGYGQQQLELNQAHVRGCNAVVVHKLEALILQHNTATCRSAKREDEVVNNSCKYDLQMQRCIYVGDVKIPLTSIIEEAGKVVIRIPSSSANSVR